MRESVRAVASRSRLAMEISEKQGAADKRKLLNFALLNCTRKGGELSQSSANPSISNRHSSVWAGRWRRRDSASASRMVGPGGLEPPTKRL